MVKKNFRRSLASVLVVFALAFSLAGALGISRSAHAQAPSPSVTPSTQPDNQIELHQALLDLTNPWTVMCIAAHPDDEDGTSLIVMRRKYGAHTVSLFSTFGEGGQNAIGPELYEELGAIRARETMAAAEIQGSEPHFLGLKDFGYSKSAAEAFKFWGHDEALQRMVLQIRKLRPDVIITNHSVTNNDHGQHQATARLELEAFDAAADPQRFPEQLKDGVTIWQVQRLFVRAGRSNQPQADTGQVVTIDPNERDPVRNTTFAEQALSALQKHATQGPWPKSVAQMAARFTNSTDGRLPVTRYRLVLEAKGAPALPKDPQTFLEGLRLPENFAKDVDIPQIDGKPLVEFAADRSKIAQALLRRAERGYHFPSEFSDFARLSLMEDRIDRATTIALGVVLEVSPASATVTPNSFLDLKIKITNTGNQTLADINCGSKIPALTEPVEPARSGPTSILTTLTELKSGAVLNKEAAVEIPAKAPVNLPLANHLYEPLALGLPVITRCSISVGVSLRRGFNATATTSLHVAPPVEITEIKPLPVVLTPGTMSGSLDFVSRLNFTVNLINHQAGVFDGKMVVTSILADSRAKDTRVTIPAGQSVRIQTTVTRPADINLKDGGNSLTFSVANGNGAVVSFRTVPVSAADAKVATRLRVGFIRGFDYSLADALAALGVESKELSVDEIKTADLQKYSTIIVDNRVYESVPGLIATNQKLLDFAKDGGTLIVFYHKSFEWNPDERRNRPQLAPYKLILGDERVTDETAPITILEPQHPLLNSPNKIGQEDFANWIQERGLYYPKEWDPQFHALLQSNDPGEPPLKGGLLVADYGRGHYIYTSMVWYRELRAGVPGAYRMFANMISYGQK
jgi:LmbE family N-acetylglucosaminyl deacetylase